ncbi:unnamed protein product, partial [Rotaria sp. Silwood1]
DDVDAPTFVGNPQLVPRGGNDCTDERFDVEEFK